MSIDIKLSGYATSDLAAIGDYIEYRLSSPQAAEKTLHMIFDTIQVLSDLPENGEVITTSEGFVTPYRVLICEKRYAISYLYDKGAHRVWIYRVFHALQDWLALLLSRSESGEFSK
ncbi:MAG: type II toxin-antitoxin system RelE/ParE family toxin [Actinomycetia bacterium]|nr:type II toxin-antitoxin system RelE/ParE family toxin [Actinomycetes bacterium]